LDAPESIAHHLFAALRELDDLDVDVILARDFGDAGLALAVRDRLTRAAEGRLVDVSAVPTETAVGRVVEAVTGVEEI
jgi:hypothetical protein